MKITDLSTDAAVLAELGERLSRTRLERNLTQRELAAQAGVERKAIQRLESGESVTLLSLIRILRALGLLEVLGGLLPEPTPSPIELLSLQGRRRRRASGARGRGSGRGERPATWRWGDERPDAGP